MTAYTKIIQVTLLGYIAISGFTGVVEGDNVVHAADQSVLRIQGDNRFETAAKISASSFDVADTVLIANAREFADALAGVPLAYQKDAPILLAQGNHLNRATQGEIERLGASHAIILGGEFAVSEGVKNSLELLGLEVERLAGDNRFETAEAISQELMTYTNSSQAVLVDGFEFADAMSVAPFAAREGMPIYLTRTHRLSTDEVMDFDATYIIGGEAAVSSNVEEQLNSSIRISGANRYETNLAVLDYFGTDSNRLFVSTGLNFADALTGSVHAARDNTGVALIRRGLHADFSNYLDQNHFDNYRILGGEAAVPFYAFWELEQYLNGSKTYHQDNVTENEVSYDFIEQENDELPVGQSRIIQHGSNGRDNVTYRVTYINGSETRREEISRNTIDPQDEIIEIGTKEVATLLEVYSDADQSPVYVNQEVQLFTRIEPEGVPSEVNWFSPDSSSVYYHESAVDEDGLFFSFRPGQFTVTAATLDGSDLEVEYPITVKDEFYLRGMTHAESELIIPDEINIEDIHSIDDYHFRYGNLEFFSRSQTDMSKKLPGDIRYVSNVAFRDGNLQRVSLPSTIINIGMQAFSNNIISQIDFSEGLKTIDVSAFRGNMLRTLELPNSVERVGSSAFENNLIEELSIPSTLTEIDRAVFSNNNLDYVSIPDSVGAIRSRAFHNNKLTGVTFPEGLKIIETSAFSTNQIEKIELPNTLTEIGPFAFSANNLENIKIPQDIKIINHASFRSNNLSNIDLNEGLLIIDRSAFDNNSELNHLNFPSTLEIIGERAFYNTQLQSIILPDSVEVIYDEAFNGSSRNRKLEEITIGSDVDIKNNVIDGTNNFKTAYEEHGAGTYRLNTDQSWSKVD